MSNVGGEDSPPEEWHPPPEWQPPSSPPVGPPPAPMMPTPYGPPQTDIVQLQPTTREVLVWETRFVMFAFLFPAVMGAVVLLAQHVNGVGSVTRFPVILQDNPVANLVVGIFYYLPVAVMVPVALHLLSRTGQTPRMLGLVRPTLRYDVWPALGLLGASFGSEIVLAIIVSPLLVHHSDLLSKTAVGPRPRVLRHLRPCHLSHNGRGGRGIGQRLPSRSARAIGLVAATSAHPEPRPAHELPRVLRHRLHFHRALRLLR